jgi:hypothetical protein
MSSHLSGDWIPGATNTSNGPIGVLDDSSTAAASARVESLRQGLRDLGHIDGQKVKIEWRFAESKRWRSRHLPRG